MTDTTPGVYITMNF